MGSPFLIYPQFVSGQTAALPILSFIVKVNCAFPIWGCAQGYIHVCNYYNHVGIATGSYSENVIINIMDDPTSDICRALAAQEKVYPLNDATEVMDNLMAMETKSNSLDDAREYIKAIAPWVSNDQRVYNNDDEPIGVSGVHTPFPQFHWKCRTTTTLTE